MTKKDQPLNLSLIDMVQKARMQHDAEAQPSQVNAVYWIEAKRENGDYPTPTTRAGYWLIPTTLEAVDALWAQIKAATVSGKLGYKSKVSTAPASGQTSANARVIHVLTYDSEDHADVERVHTTLVELGIEGELTYHQNR